MADRHCEFLIVGGGSAGCALAHRLSEDPTHRVVVLEAGRPDSWWDILIHMPAAFAFPLGNRFYDWGYQSEPEPHMAGRRIYHARGKLLGGSNSINGMIFQRGNSLDYDAWAQRPGLERWSYAHCLPYFKRMESCETGEDAYRGRDGPLVLERGQAQGPLFDTPFPGLIDEVEIFNRALEASEIQAIFDAGSAGKCEPPDFAGRVKVGGHLLSVLQSLLPSPRTSTGSRLASLGRMRR